MVSISKVATKFAKQLLESYENGTHILECFRMYMGFIHTFGGHIGTGKDLRLVTSWQMEDMETSLWNDKIDYTRETLETIWNKNRRSAKTENATLIATFCGILNKEVKWRSCYMPQMKEAKIWYHLNPFVKKINNHEGLVYLRGGYYPVDLSVLTPANVTGVECDVAIFDEGSWAFKGLQLYEAYRQARPMVSTSDFKHILHVSTPALSTSFAEAWDYLTIKEDKMNTKFTVLRTVDDCPWITPEFIEEERLVHADCLWYVDQNYYGVFVVPGGAVFSNYYDVNDSLHVSDELYERFRKATPRHGGVDWNGEVTQHYLVLCYIDADYIFVKKEIKFLDIKILKNYERNVSLELEDDDPYSDEYAQTAKEIGIRCAYFGWNEATKMERVRQVKARKVIIDRGECPTVWKNFQEAGFALSTQTRMPIMEKRSDQHGIDGVLHATHVGDRGYTKARLTGERGLDLFGKKKLKTSGLIY